MQQVSINADFPNVTDSQEILDAFNTMDKQKHCVKMLRIGLFN